MMTSLTYLCRAILRTALISFLLAVTALGAKAEELSVTSLEIQVLGNKQAYVELSKAFDQVGGSRANIALRYTDKLGAQQIIASDVHLGRTLVAIDLCPSNDCVALRATPKLSLAGPSLQEVGKALRQALTGFADTDTSGSTSQTEVLAFLARTLKSSVEQNEQSSAALTVETAFLSPALDDLKAAYIESLDDRAALQSGELKVLQDRLRDCHFCVEQEAIKDKLRSLAKASRFVENFQRTWKAALASGNAATLIQVIERCENCSRLSEMLDLPSFYSAKDRQAVELAVWTKALESGRSSVMQSVVLACKDCRFVQNIDLNTLQGDSEAVRTDLALWRGANAAGSALAYKEYLDECQSCMFEIQAEARLTEIRQSAASLTDRSLLAIIEAKGDLESLQAYLEGCEVCEQAEDITARLDAMLLSIRTSQDCLASTELNDEGLSRLKPQDAKQALKDCQTALRSSNFEGQEDLRAVLQLGQAEALRLTGAPQKAVAILQDLQTNGYVTARGALALSLFQATQPNSVERDALLAHLEAHQSDSHPQIVLVRALLAIEQLDADQRLLQHPRIIRQLQQSAESGERIAHFTLGILYSFGQLTNTDMDAAAIAFKNAAALGHIEAMAYFADHLERGLGVNVDYDLAAQLFYRSFKLGSPWAYKRLYDQGRSRPLAIMKKVQQLMLEDRVYRSTVDGLFGGGTRAALRRALKL